MQYKDKEKWSVARDNSRDVLGSAPVNVGPPIASDLDIHYNYWPSIIDMLETDFSHIRNEQQWKEYRDSSWANQKRWLGIKNLDAVDHAMRHGWLEGLEKARNALDKIDIPKFKSVKRRKRRKDYGDELDMQSVYSGNLDRAWTQTNREYSPARSPRKVTLIASSALPSSIAPDEVFWTGAVALRINDALQESGRSVQIISSKTNNMLSHVLSANVVIKDYQQPLEPEVVAATLCLAGFIRGPMFRAQCLHDMKIDDSWGYAIQNFVASQYRETSDSVFMISGIFSKQQAEEKIQELVGKIGGEA